MHYPVMVDEVIRFLSVKEDGTYVDATTGLGGHSEAIVRKLTTGRLVANDRDAESLQLAGERLAPWKERVTLLRGVFSDLSAGLARLGMKPVDGLVADLGVSYMQLTESERGFSFMSDGPLDMRMDRGQDETAADLINHIAERDLTEILRVFGEERRARKLARAVVRARPIRSTGHLTRVIESVSPSTSRLHPATRTFMALRIAVNRELEELDALLEDLPDVLARGGRAVFLTFHSLEDRRVKHRFRALAREGRAILLTKHVVRPSQEELEGNPPSRSAKLRALEMKQTGQDTGSSHRHGRRAVSVMESEPRHPDIAD